MNSKNILVLAFFAIVLSSCDYQKQNTSLNEQKELMQKDLREGDKVVYGVSPDSAAVQTKNKYPSKPEYDVRTQKIREKLAKQN
jgi:uncharacterized protein YheU (UPF0270 family)